MDMISVVIAGIVGIVLLTLSQLFRWRVPEGMAYIRRGLGSEQVFIARRFWALPFFQQILAVDLRPGRLEVRMVKEQSVLTADPLRMDVEVGVLVRISSANTAVAAAMSAFGCEFENIRPLLEERCKSAVQTAAADLTLNTILKNQAGYELAISTLLAKEFTWAGLEVLMVTVSKVSQTAQIYYQRNESNIDAEALSRLEVMRLEVAQQLYSDLRTTTLAMKKLDLEACLKELEWDTEYYLAALEQKRCKSEMEAITRQSIAEIEVSQALAAEVLKRDVEVARCQYAQELAVLDSDMSRYSKQQAVA